MTDRQRLRHPSPSTVGCKKNTLKKAVIPQMLVFSYKFCSGKTACSRIVVNAYTATTDRPHASLPLTEERLDQARRCSLNIYARTYRIILRALWVAARRVRLSRVHQT